MERIIWLVAQLSKTVFYQVIKFCYDDKSKKK